MKVIGLTGMFFLALMFDLPLLLQQRKRSKMLSVYFFILLSAYGIGVLLVIDKTPMSPAILIEKAVKLVFPK